MLGLYFGLGPFFISAGLFDYVPGLVAPKFEVWMGLKSVLTLGGGVLRTGSARFRAVQNSAA